MNRATRRALAKKDTADKVLHTCLAEQQKTVSNKAVNAMLTMMFTVLHDKFGFGQARIKRVWDEMQSLAECIDSDRVSMKDLESVLRDELEVKFID